MKEDVSMSLVLENIGELLTMDPDQGDGEIGLVRNAAVAIKAGRILWAGPQGELEDHVVMDENVHRLDAGKKVVLPGLVDCHTHLVFGGSREKEFALRVAGATYQEIAAAGGGIVSTMHATRSAGFEELVGLGLERLNRLLHFGVTTCEIKSGYGLSVEDELKMLRVVKALEMRQPVSLVPTFLGAHTVPPEYRARRQDYLDLVISEMLPRVVEEGLAEFCDIFCEEGVFSVEESRMVLTAAKAAGLRLKVHAEQLTPFGGARLAAELGAVSADHLEHVDETSIAAMREAGTVAVLLPGATFFLNQPFPDVRRLVDAGLTIAISTDFNPGSSPVMSLPLVGTMAAVRMRLPITHVFQGMTCNAAKAIARENEVGRIVPGMAADLAVFDVTDHRTLLYQFGVNHCKMVIKKGEVVS